MSNPKDRLLSFLNHLNIGQTKFEELTGLSRGYISNLKGAIGPDKLVRIMKKYPTLNIMWLISGEGNMLVDDSSVGIPDFSTVMNVKLVGQYAHAGYLCGYSDPEYMESLPVIPFPSELEHKGNYLCFEVKGDSMDDGSKYSYEQGDVVLCREIPKHLWVSRLHYNKWNAFVIVHNTEGVLIKQIVGHDTERGQITIHSLNPLYEDRTINLDDIRVLFNVVKTQKNR